MTPRPHHLAVAALAAALAGATGCGRAGDDTAAPAPTTVPGTAAATTAVIVPPAGPYDPAVDPANFVTAIDNPYLPWVVGSSWVYEGESDGELERIDVVVTDERRTVMGVAVTVVRDTVSVDGQVVEDTLDWYAQDVDGNVWYFGEEVKNFDAGRLTDTDGSWEAGVGGALPGIAMPADPTVGEAYRQEYFVGEAEDLGEVIAVGGAAEVPAGRFDDVVTTRDWNPLEPDVIEEKQYAPGVGLIAETKVTGDDGMVELVEFTSGS